MSHSSASNARALTLTEELEKLEQTITLTLQEIDHNFSKAHRIVTSSILPVVEQYAKHSEAVWEGSKFWKQFFEASANVSLSGYEEGAAAEGTSYDDTETTTADQTQTTPSSSRADDTITTTPVRDHSHYSDVRDSSLLDSPSVAHAHSTPRMPVTVKNSKRARVDAPATFADFPSPYETLKQEVHGSSPASAPAGGVGGAGVPSTPGKASVEPLPDMSMSPESSPFGPAHQSGNAYRSGGPVNPDPLLHRMLDKTYRIQATPHTARRKPARGVTAATPGTATRRRPARTAALDSLTDDGDDDDDDEGGPPQLRAELFSSPVHATPRTPGVSVHAGGTPGLKDRLKGRGDVKQGGKAGMWDSESDDGMEGEDVFSPPKTIQFHVPQSKLLQTPAREASKRIVEDLLLTAGGDITESVDEDSPSVVRRNQELDDSF